MPNALIMRAGSTREPFNRPGWIFELKFDGYRGLVEKRDGHVSIRTKSGMDVTNDYPQIADAARALKASQFLLGGELVAADPEGRPRVGLLRVKWNRPQALYFAFDLLECGGKNLRFLPLRKRKARLAKLLKKAPRTIQYVWHVSRNGVKLFREVSARGLEGVMAKRADSTYRAGRSRDWVKIKC